MSAQQSSGPNIEVPIAFSLLRRLHLLVSLQQRQKIYESVLSGSHADLEYGALVALAALIALFGLLQNSAAVIIGAMLISPMMNPLLAGALALLLGDGRLGRRSSIVLGGSVIASVVITWFVASLIPLNQATPEILARTTPNLLDLFIAFLSGFAGTLALRGGPSSLMILPGVAIAVAVVPPLAVVGYGLSTRQLSISAGAFLLFLTNLVAIVLSAALVFRSMGFRPQRAAEAGRWKLKYRMAISAGVLLILSIPLFFTLRRAVSQIRLRSDVSNRLDAELHADNASLADLALSFAGRRLQIHATVRATKYLDPSQIGEIEKSLQARFGPDTDLHVDQILVAVGGVAAPPAPSRNAISGGGVRPVEQPPPFDFKASELSLIQHLQSELDGLLVGAPMRRTTLVQVRLSGAPSVFVSAAFTTPGPIAPQMIELLSSQLSAKMAVPIRLNGTAELSGGSYRHSFDAAPLARLLHATDRRALEALIQTVRLDPNLRLDVSYRLPHDTEESKTPPLVGQLRALFARSGLKTSQWTIQQASVAIPSLLQPPPPTSAAPTAVEAPAAAQVSQSTQVRYDCHVVQTF